MTPEQYGLWTYAREVSHESGIFYAGRNVGKQFNGTGKDSVYRIIKRLVKDGWFRLLRKSTRNRATGLWRPAEYYPLSVEEWAKKHPKQLRKPINVSDELDTCLENETGDESDLSGISTDLSGNPDNPVEISPLSCLEIQNKSGREESDKESLEKREEELDRDSRSDKPTPMGKKIFEDSFVWLKESIEYESNLLLSDSAVHQMQKFLEPTDTQEIVEDALYKLIRRGNGWTGLTNVNGICVREFPECLRAARGQLSGVAW